MKIPWFHIVAFLVAAGLPSWASFLASRKYDDISIFVLCTVASVILAGVALGVSYARDRRLQKKHEQSQRSGT